MTLAAAVLLALTGAALVGLICAAVRLDRRVRAARSRLAAVAGGFREARALTESRARLRTRQKRVEAAVDTGTMGIETAHRTVAGYLGRPGGERGGRFYARVRGMNRVAGEMVAGWLAPRGRPDSEKPARDHTRDGSRSDDS